MNNGSRLSDAELTTLRDLIYRKTGIFYTGRNRYLLDARAHEALRENGSRNTASYLDLLARTNITSPEWSHLISKVTFAETSFFRDPLQAEALRASVLPQLLRRREQTRSRLLRV